MLISLVSGLFLIFEKGFSIRGYFPPENLLFLPFGKKIFSFPRLALRNLHLFLLKMLITATTAVSFLVFAVWIAISSAFVVSLRAVLATLIGQGL
jgi:hypothetical protein